MESIPRSIPILQTSEQNRITSLLLQFIAVVSIIYNLVFIKYLYVIQCMLPFHFVENAAFLAFIHALCPGYQVPTRATLHHLAYELYATHKTTLIQDLEGVSFKSTTFDMWTGPHNYGVLGITLHWISNFQLISKIIGNY